MRDTRPRQQVDELLVRWRAHPDLRAPPLQLHRARSRTTTTGSTAGSVLAGGR